jgi:biopolymer transport protein ExbB/TolQ
MLTSAFYVALTFPAFRIDWANRLFCGHPVKPVLTGLFFWGITALAWKARRVFRELRVLSSNDWGRVAERITNIADAMALFGPAGTLPRDVVESELGHRLSTALAHGQRGASDELEQRLEQLADRAGRELSASYEWINTVCRVIPILGILGTLISTMAAISGLGGSSGSDVVTNLLAAVSAAGETTAVALLLWVPLVLAKSLLSRLEDQVLKRVAAVAHVVLGDCMSLRIPESRAFLGVVDGVSRIILQSTRDAWREQGQLWSRTVEHVGESQVAALHAAVEKSVERFVANQGAQFQRFLGGLDALRQLSQKSLADVAAKMAAHQAAAKRQVELLELLVGEEGRMTNLQRSLNDNLATLANVQALDQAINSLTAAAHLLTVRSGRALTEPRVARAEESQRGVAA